VACRARLGIRDGGGKVSSISVRELISLQTANFLPISSARSRMPGRPWCPLRPPAPRTSGSIPLP
jgi:hypothetical protein